MRWRDHFGAMAGGRWLVLRLLAFVLLLGSASYAHAGSTFCSQYPLNAQGFHVIDGNDPTLTTANLPTSIGIDANCYFMNFPLSSKWPQGLTSTLNFKSTPTPVLAIFDNVYYTGNMACSTTTTTIWFVNGSLFAGNNQCQALIIPVEAIGKAAPGPSATIGVPFTYTMTIPIMYASGTYYNQPSTNTLSNATIYDDLTATGASLTYVSNTAYLVNGSITTPIGPLTLGATSTTLSTLGIPASDSTKHIVFSSDYNPALTNIAAGTQIVIQLTVMLDNVPTNTAGTQFTNTAQWWFGRSINGVFYDPLPGQNGVSPPMTIVEPNLTLQKSSSLTNISVGTAAPFQLNVQNIGGADAWNTTVTDILPTGMCAYNPTPTVTAQVFASDGATPVSGVLVAGTDYTVSYSGCTLSLTMLSAAAKIGPTQRLIINYHAMLDAGTAPGLTFTNLAGATQWYSGPSIDTGRRVYNQTLTNGTPGVLDFQDAYTVTSTTQGYFFLKSVGDLTTGTPVTTAAFPGDRLIYTFQIQNFTYPTLSNITVNDDFDALNAAASFAPGTLALVSSNLPAGATLTVNPTGGSKGTGSISITGLTLPQNAQYQVQVAITLASGLMNGTNVLNQGSLTGTDPSNVVWSGVSDDPYINGPSLLSATGDPTPVQIYAPGALSKANTQATATIGQQFKYRITVPATPVNVPLYDVRILDNLGLSAANLSFVSATVVSGGTWTVTNTGSATNLVLQDTNTGIDIPAGGQAVIDVTVVLQNTSANQKGLTFTNSASYTYDKINGDATTQGSGGGATTGNMTVVEPALSIAKAVSYASPAGKAATAPAAAGDVLQYTVTVTNNGTSTAYAADVLDALPSNLSLVTGSATATINGVAVSGFIATPTVLASGMLAWGAQNGDNSLNIPVGQSLVLSFQASVLAANGTPITNTAYTDWTSLGAGVTGERTGAGCPNVTAPNTYCAGPATATVTSIDPTALAKAVASDSWTTAPSPATLRVGDIVVYTLTLTLLEGSTQNVVLSDTLPPNMVFNGIISIDGVTTAPYNPPTSGAGSNFSYTLSSYPTAGQTGTVTWNFGNIYNTVDNIASNNNLVVQYGARVVNTLPATPTSQALTNNATLNYAINGVAAAPKTANAPISVLQPLLAVSKTAAPANGGTVVAAGELVTYTVNITNSGLAPAYNPVLQDILPVGMRNATPSTVSVSLNGTALPTVTPTYSSSTGVATWNFASGVANQYTIPPGQTLTVVYQAQVDTTVGAGMILTNQASVQHYYSLDSYDPSATFRKDYGATGAAMVQLTTAAAGALSKQAMVATAAIGQPFTYQITIPATPQSTALYDVQVQDNISLTTTGVSLTYLGSSAKLASGAKTWAALSNTGTATNLTLQDTSTGGLDIPAGDQLIVTVTMVLSNDIANNTAGKQFSNTATYTYDSINNNAASQANGAPGASGPITVIAPNLTMQKSGPATMLNAVPGTFTLNVQNTGGATAWNPVLTDILPNGTTGGMCASAPTGITAQVYQSNGTTAVSAPLVNGTDFTVSFAAAPSCTLTINFLTPATAIPSTDRLIVTYSASLDPGTANGVALTNIAGATQWLSANPSVAGATGNVHTFSNTLTNGTPGVTDFQDAFTTTSAAPVLSFTKTAFDVTTGQSGANARPGDTLKYTLTIQNVSPVAANNFSLTDVLDALNSPAMFVPGTLTLVTVPAAANTSLTSATGGPKGTGIVSISGLSVGAQGSATATATIVFTAQLVPVINSGTVVLNQAQIGSSTLATQLSNDPSLSGTNNPTRTLIASAPAWRVLKTVQDVTSGTSVVMAGDVLRYTITVKNIGTENATGVTLTDAIPNFTTYVAGSTRLNGNAMADPTAGVSALQNGMLINVPSTTTPGSMTADATATTTNVATITFEVKINASVINGTIVSNQGFVNGSGTTSGPFATAPSDNPNTAAVNDPTNVIVGNLPLLNATKTVALAVDYNGNGVIDAGDIVRYTITVNNYSNMPATGVKLTDATPANTTYVANTVTLNGTGVGQPDGGVSPLAAGISINSPGAAPGTIAGNGQAVVTFEVQVNATVAGGTVISNQGTVTSTQLPSLPTDADGNPSNGYQATTFVVGSAQQVSITKQVSVVGGGAALPGSQLDYLVTVTNIGAVPATNVVLTDDLSQAPLSTQVSYVAGSAMLNGSSAGVSFTSNVLTANYGATYGNLAPGATAQLDFRVTIAAGLATGVTITNTGQGAWNSPALTATASASVSVGGTPGTATLAGHAWHDANFNQIFDTGEPNLVGWAVDVYRNNVLLGSVLTDANGLFTITGLAPTTTASDQYSLLFVAPGATATTAKMGRAASSYINGEQSISGITASSGSNIQNLNLPITPNGVTYDSILRTPVAGATLNMTRAGSTIPLPATCFDDPAQQGQVTLASGYYKFDLNFSDPACPSNGDYLVQVTPPPAYAPGQSLIIPPTSGATTPTFSVPNCPGTAADAIPATTNYCEAQPSEFAPALTVPPNTVGTDYYLHMTFNNTFIPGTSEIFDNHIPLDPRLNNAVSITKVSALVNVTRGQLVPYTITVNNSMAATLSNMKIVDSFPPGFKYVAGSGRLDGQPVEPTATGNQLVWGNLQLVTNTKRVIQLMLVVGSGVAEAEYVNRAQVFDTVTGGAASGEATATVRVIPDPTLDCSDVIGKVFDDANLNGYQDEGEEGLAGVRVVTANGLLVTTDKYGRFHITCAVVPDPDRGSNFILKVDDRTLPSGYRLTTENPRVQRATRGKILKFNFGAAIHKVVKLDIADAVFEPGTTEMRAQWKPRIDLLLGVLKKAPSVLRLSYLADAEDEGLVKARLEMVKQEIVRQWQLEKGNYELTIETEVFWRTGAPPEKREVK
jgi:uncharacterized repeat protein (TIGR01451 family)/fimbrial isopeptide formation D2 family protein